MISPRKAILALAGAMLVGGCATGPYYDGYGYGYGANYNYYPYDYYYGPTYYPSYGYSSYGRTWNDGDGHRRWRHRDGDRDHDRNWRDRRPPRDSAGVVTAPEPPMPSPNDPGVVTPAPNSRHYSPG